MELSELRRRRLAHLERRPDDPDEEFRRRDEAQRQRLASFLGPAALAYALADPVGQAPVEEPRLSTPTPTPVAQQPPADTAPAERECRICHGGPELGVLFSPCRCRGTSRFVHVSCLAAWRTISLGRSSFHACDVCGFRYSTRRAKWAHYLEWETPVMMLAATLVVLLVMCAALIAHVTTGARIAALFYKHVRWVPPGYGGWLYSWFRPLSRFTSMLDAAVAGIVICGVAGTALSAARRYRRDPQAFWQAVAPTVGMAFLTSGTPALRIFVAGGLCWGFAALAHALKIKAKSAITRFGEIVLDIGEDSESDMQ